MKLTDDNKSLLNTNSIIKVRCDYCGEEKEVIMKNYKKSLANINKYACKNCVGYKCNEITLNKRREDYMQRLLERCNDAGYSLLSNKNDIQNNRSYINYHCPIHGTHTMRIGNFLSGKGCPECSKDAASKRYRNSTETIIARINDNGGVLLNSEDYINNRTKNLRIICPSCGNEFLTSYVLFVQHNGQLCSKCSSSMSVGEARVRRFLESKSIYYLQQYWFPDCRDIKPLPFDFYIPDYNVIIEFDGQQHFKETDYFSYGLAKTQLHDQIKNNYCEANNISLIRIPYTKLNQLDKILNKVFT